MHYRRILPLAILFGLSAVAVHAQPASVQPSGRSDPAVFVAANGNGVQRFAQQGGQMAQGMMGQGMMAQGMMGQGMMGQGRGGRSGYGGVAPSAPTGQAAGEGGGVETVCGFAGGNPTHGAAIYAQTCVACHGANGRGRITGAPNFTRKGGVLSKPHSALQAHIVRGFSSTNSPISMPPRGGNPGLTDQDIRDVHAYLHKRFGCG